MAYTVGLKGLDKYRSDSEIDAEWLRTDGGNEMTGDFNHKHILPTAHSRYDVGAIATGDTGAIRDFYLKRNFYRGAGTEDNDPIPTIAIADLRAMIVTGDVQMGNVTDTNDNCNAFNSNSEEIDGVDVQEADLTVHGTYSADMKVSASEDGYIYKDNVAIQQPDTGVYSGNQSFEIHGDATCICRVSTPDKSHIQIGFFKEQQATTGNVLGAIDLIKGTEIVSLIGVDYDSYTLLNGIAATILDIKVDYSPATQQFLIYYKAISAYDDPYTDTGWTFLPFIGNLDPDYAGEMYFSTLFVSSDYAPLSQNSNKLYNVQLIGDSPNIGSNTYRAGTVYTNNLDVQTKIAIPLVDATDSYTITESSITGGDFNLGTDLTYTSGSHNLRFEAVGHAGANNFRVDTLTIEDTDNNVWFKTTDTLTPSDENDVRSITFLPLADATYSLGTADLSWGDVHTKGNLNITGDVTAPNSIQFDLTPTVTPAEGMLYWNSDDGTLDLGLPGGNVNLQLGQEMVIRGQNDQGVQINNGEVVFISGGSGANSQVQLADADLESAHKTLAVATENVASSQFGYFTTEGLVRDINTNAWTPGTQLYLSQTAGQLTSTRPTAPAHTTEVGIVIRQHSSQGIIYVKIHPHPPIDELSDVNITSVADNDVLYWNNANSRWENQTVEELGYVPYTGATQDVDLGLFDLEATELRIKATSDHTINNSADDFLITNFNTDKSVCLKATDGTNNATVELDGTDGSFIIGNDGSFSNTLGIVRATGTYNVAAPMAALRFSPTLTGGSPFFGMLIDPDLSGHTSNMIGLKADPTVTGKTSNGGLDFLQMSMPKITDYTTTTNAYTESISRTILNVTGVIDDVGSIVNNGFTIGAAASFANFAPGVGISLTDDMITLVGGVNSYTNIGTGALTQKGVNFQGFGSVAGGTCKAMEANGGLFDFAFDDGADSAVRLGAAQDAAIGYDGTNMTIKPAVVGSGHTDIQGTYGTAITTVSANTTLDQTHSTVIVDASAAARTITLPAASGVTGRIYKIKSKDSTNVVTVDGNASETIDGSLTITLAKHEVITIQSDGTEWWII